MESERRGIAAAGNWIVDQVKIVDVYPRQDALANITAITRGNGGAAYNVLKDLALFGAGLPLEAIGLLGEDAAGREILEDCRAHGIDVAQLRTTAAAPTSFTDVMNVAGTGRRTFFHHRGANALFDLDGCDLSRSRARIFHLGYLLLLDRLDQPSAAHGTRAAELLAAARAAGMKTSIDVVSEDGRRFAEVVTPALRQTDYCILNEFEAEQTTGVGLRTEAGLRWDELGRAAEELLARGVREWVVIHFPEGAFARSAAGEVGCQGSLRLPEAWIAGTAGAGDAFCAGVLLGLHEGWAMERCLRFAACAAAGSMRDVTCSAGVERVEKLWELEAEFGWRDVGVA